MSSGDCCHKAAMFDKLTKLARREIASPYHEIWKIEIICEPGMSLEEAVRDAQLPMTDKDDE